MDPTRASDAARRRVVAAVLDGVDPTFAGTDPHNSINAGDPDFAVADLAGAGGIDDGVDDTVDITVVAQDLDLQLGHEVHGVLRPAVHLCVASLTAESAAVLNQQANWMSQFPELRFSVYGHTDLVGSNAYNKALGRKRAETVVAYLAARGISRNRLQALVSYGETQPIVMTEQPEMRNRRTVTEVSGFLQRQNAPLNGKYAAVIMREYVDSAVRPIKPPTNVQSQVVQGN